MGSPTFQPAPNVNVLRVRLSHHSPLLQELPPGDAFVALAAGGDAASRSGQVRSVCLPLYPT
jgi:hypothetical protein